jgi:hypothetical protein
VVFSYCCWKEKKAGKAGCIKETRDPAGQLPEKKRQGKKKRSAGRQTTWKRRTGFVLPADTKRKQEKCMKESRIQTVPVVVQANNS